jgi:hypothetical protein
LSPRWTMRATRLNALRLFECAHCFDKGCREKSDVAGTKLPKRSFPLKCGNLARGESMKDPVSVLGSWRGFHFGSTAPLKAIQLKNDSNDYFTFSRARAARSSDQEARPRHHSRGQTGERHPGPPRLFRPRSVCTKLPDRLHRLSKPDTSAWCPPFPKTTHGGMELEEGGHAGTEWNRRARPETARKLLIGKAIVEA